MKMPHENFLRAPLSLYETWWMNLLKSIRQPVHQHCSGVTFVLNSSNYFECKWRRVKEGLAKNEPELNLYFF